VWSSPGRRGGTRDSLEHSSGSLDIGRVNGRVRVNELVGLRLGLGSMDIGGSRLLWCGEGGGG
jgi:hypothetical protein